MDLSNVMWRKASYSGANGGGCVEVGLWRKASYRGGNGGGCVEVATAGTTAVAVRDSKNPHGPRLAFAPSVWQSFVGQIRGRLSGS